MNRPVDYDETCRQNQNDDITQMIIPQTKSAVSPQECVGNKAKKPPAILQSRVRPRTLEENGAKVPVTSVRGYPKDTKGRSSRKKEESKMGKHDRIAC